MVVVLEKAEEPTRASSDATSSPTSILRFKILLSFLDSLLVVVVVVLVEVVTAVRYCGACNDGVWLLLLLLLWSVTTGGVLALDNEDCGGWTAAVVLVAPPRW